MYGSMEAVRPFPGVLQIGFHDREEDLRKPLVVRQGFGLEWPASDFGALSLQTHASIDMDCMSVGDRFRQTGNQRCMKTPERRCSIDAPISWQSDWNGISNRLPYDVNIPCDDSSKSRWSRIDQDTSCSGGSTWSPRTSDSCSEADGYLSHHVPSKYDHIALDPDCPSYPGSFSFEGPYSGPGCATVVSPHDLHPNSDPEDYMDEVNDRPELHEISASEHYIHEDSGRYVPSIGSNRYGQEDEGLGSSIQDESKAGSVQYEDDSAMGDSVDPNGDDDDDDYNPRLERRGQGHRHSNKSSTSKPLTLAPKRPQRGKNITSQAVKPTKISKKPAKATNSPPSTHRNPNQIPCPHCECGLASVSALKKHVLGSHTRPFICTFHDYGCTITVSSKNEWKRHINVQHMHLETWRCDIGSCANQSNLSKSHKASPSPLGRHTEAQGSGAHDFDRKDLFTQHLKRMHVPPPSASKAEKKRFEESIDGIRSRCYKKLREPPTNSICPYCPHHPVFENWEDRVEHVGKHLERSDFDKNNEVEDIVLREWLIREHYLVWKPNAGGWRLLETGKKRKNRGEKPMGEGEEDAEGDEE